MATREFEDFEKILREIEPQTVPSKYVTGACVTDFDDETYIITRDELEEIMSSDESLEDQGIMELGLILDLPEIKNIITKYTEIILKNIAS